jgi:hypothetical protein
MLSPEPHPDPFLAIRWRDAAANPPMVGVCAGYEQGEWRAEQLAKHLIEWIPEFALTFEERKSLQNHNATSLVGKAAKAVYTSDKYQRRGEIGELLLHIILRQEFGSLPAISKYYFKDGSNETVKGFDAVHAVATDTKLELWLGEVKFYSEIKPAIREVVTEIKNHTERNYFKSESAFILNKVDDAWPHAEKLKALLHRNRSLDDIFSEVVIPVFLTYESASVAAHNAISEEFHNAVKEELRLHHAEYLRHGLNSPVRIQLIFFPLQTKRRLLDFFDRKLKACQTLA